MSKYQSISNLSPESTQDVQNNGLNNKVSLTEDDIAKLVKFTSTTLNEINAQKRLVNWMSGVLFAGLIVIVLTVAGLVSAYIWGQTQAFQQGFRDMRDSNTKMNESSNELNSRIDVIDTKLQQIQVNQANSNGS